MNVGSVFSGVGGFDLGLERAGMRTLWFCEQEAFCQRVLAEHWPGVPCYPDVRLLSRGRGGATRCDGSGEHALRPKSSVRLQVPQVDVLCGGFPCQDLSVAGRRAGLAGERSGLFFEFARVADELVRPGGWILIENVPGLLSSACGRDFAVLLRTLGDIGFHDLAWRVLDSRYFGVPQRRRRVYILGRRASGDRARAVLLEPESGGGDFAPSREAGTRVAATASRGSHGAGVSPPGRRQEDDENIVSALDCKRGGADDNDAQAGHLVAVVGREERDRDRRDGQDADRRRAPELQPQQPADHQQEVAPAIVKRYAKSTDSDASDALVAGTVRSHMRPGSNSSDVVLGEQPRRGRGEPDRDVAQDGRREGGPGLPGSEDRLDGTPSDPDGVRAPSGLSGWPHDPEQVDPRPDGPRYAAMGNAVTVNVAHWIGSRLAEWERLAA